MKNASRENSKSWVIAAICCFINFLHLGIARQSGLLYLAAIDRYDANRNQASLPFVLCYTVRNISGPFVGFLGRKVGLERVTIFGCVLASVGMGACFLAEDILTVTLLWGGVFGLGFGMGSVLIPVVLNQHFDKHLSNANGIAFGGECVAGFILPILVKILLNTFGTSGLFLILSGLILHSVPAAILLKISANQHSKISFPNPISTQKGSSDFKLFPNGNGIYCKNFKVIDNFNTFQADSKTLNVLSTLDENTVVCSNIPSEKIIERYTYVQNQRVQDSVSCELYYAPQEQHLNGAITNQIVLQDSTKIHNSNTYKSCDSVLSTIQCKVREKMQGEQSYSIRELELASNQCNNPEKNYHGNSYEKSDSVLSTKKCNELDKRYDGNSIINRDIVLSSIHCNANEVLRDGKSYLNSELRASSEKYNITESYKESATTAAFSSFRVFYDPAFILMLLTQSSFIFIATMIMTIIVDLSRDAGVTSDEEIYILMCLSISDMIGRFGLGWVTDSGYMSPVAFSALCFFSLGAILSALAFLKSFVLIMSAAFFIGLFLGGLLIVCPGVVCDHIEKEKVTMALASRFVLYAPISLTQSSLIGFFRETKGSYNGILYILTVVCLLCCAMSLLIPFASRIRENRKYEKQKMMEKAKT